MDGLGGRESRETEKETERGETEGDYLFRLSKRLSAIEQMVELVVGL